MPNTIGTESEEESQGKRLGDTENRFADCQIAGHWADSLFTGEPSRCDGRTGETGRDLAYRVLEADNAETIFDQACQDV